MVPLLAVLTLMVWTGFLLNRVVTMQDKTMQYGSHPLWRLTWRI
jgi:hypothetical protein